jgi:hypothetical protein
VSVCILVQQEDRGSLAMRVTPEGVRVLLPRDVDPEGERARAFIEAGLARLPEPEPAGEPLDRAALQALVDQWAGRLDATVSRIQVRSMRRKWASFSSKGTLTLARDLLALPVDLIEYAICHELLHQRLPDHGKGFQAMLAAWMPDWRERERRLMAQASTGGNVPDVLEAVLQFI